MDMLPERETHEHVDGYTLWSNFSPLGMVISSDRLKLETFESLTEKMQHDCRTFRSIRC